MNLKNTHTSFLFASALAVATPIVLGGCFITGTRTADSPQTSGSRTGRAGASSARAPAGAPDQASSAENEARFKAMSFPSLQTCKVTSSSAAAERTVWFKAFGSRKAVCNRGTGRWRFCWRQLLHFVEVYHSGDKYRVTRLGIVVHWGATPEVYKILPFNGSSRRYRRETKRFVQPKNRGKLQHLAYLEHVEVGFTGKNVANFKMRRRKTRGFIKGGGWRFRFSVKHTGSVAHGPNLPAWLPGQMSPVRGITRYPHNCPSYHMRSVTLGPSRSWSKILLADNAIMNVDGLQMKISKHLRTVMFKKLRSLGIRNDFSFTPPPPHRHDWMNLSNLGPIRHSKIRRWAQRIR
jgi:hypothetical protein